MRVPLPKLHQAADVSGAAPRLLWLCDACLIDDRREALTLAAHISSETFGAEPARLDAERGQPHLDLRLLADRGQLGDNLGDNRLVRPAGPIQPNAESTSKPGSDSANVGTSGENE